MIPISESAPIRRPSWITSILIALCLLLFLYELMLPAQGLDRFLQQWGANPQSIRLALAGDPSLLPDRVGVLININREIAAGLRTTSQAA